LTEIESIISHKLNHAVDNILPDNLNGILSKNDLPVRKNTIPIYKFAVAACFVLIVSFGFYLIKQNGMVSSSTAKSTANAPGSFASDQYGYALNDNGSSSSGIYLNEGSAVQSTSTVCIAKAVPLASESDVAGHFGFDPLDGLWLPPDLKSCFYDKADPKSCQAYAYFQTGGKFLWLTSSYRSDPKDDNSRTISITLSPDQPAVSDIEPTGKLIASHINNTEVFITHQPKSSGKNPANEMFSAKFSYKDVGYSIYTYNGVTEAELVNMLTSLIK
jgi:hypothetical protein